MTTLAQPRSRQWIGALAAAVLALGHAAHAGPDDTHEHHRDEVWTTRQTDDPAFERMVVASRQGSIDIAPHGTELPKWAKKVRLTPYDEKTEILVIARVHAEHEGVIEHASPTGLIRKGAFRLATAWGDHPEDHDGAYGTHFVVRVPKLHGVDAKTAMGGVIVQKAKGPTRAASALGSISLIDLAEDAEAKSAQGSISITFEKGNASRASAETAMGGISIVGASWVNAKSGQGSISAVLADPPADDMELVTALGSISLGLPAGTDADITASTTMGDVSVAGTRRPSKALGPMKSVRSTLGKGGISIACTTQQGDVSVGG